MEKTPQSLIKIVELTNLLVRLYDSKQHWHKIYPLVTALAEQIDQTYQSAPQSILVQLSFYIKKQGYTANLALNHSVLACVLAHAEQLNQTSRRALISAAFCLYICIRKELNTLAVGKKLSTEQTKQWKKRTALTLALLKNAKIPQRLIVKLVEQYEYYEKVIKGKKPGLSSDRLCTLLAITGVLSQKITASRTLKSTSLQDGIKSLYINTQSLHVKEYLMSLLRHLPIALPGQVCKIDATSSGLFVAELEKGQYLYFQLSEPTLKAQGQFIRSKRAPRPQSIQRVCEDKGLLFKLWFSPLHQFLAEHSLKLIAPQYTPPPIAELNQQQQALLSHRVDEVSELVSAIERSPQVSRFICEKALSASQSKNEIQTSKHAVMMLGIIRTPHLIKQGFILNSLMSQGHHQQQQLLNKLHNLSHISAACAEHCYEFLPEEVHNIQLLLALPIFRQRTLSTLPIHFNTRAPDSADWPLKLNSLFYHIKAPLDENTAQHWQIESSWMIAVKQQSLLPDSVKQTKTVRKMAACLGLSNLLYHHYCNPSFNWNAYCRQYREQALKLLGFSSISELQYKLSSSAFKSLL